MEHHKNCSHWGLRIRVGVLAGGSHRVRPVGGGWARCWVLGEQAPTFVGGCFSVDGGPAAGINRSGWCVGWGLLVV